MGFIKSKGLYLEEETEEETEETEEGEGSEDGGTEGVEPGEGGGEGEQEGNQQENLQQQQEERAQKKIEENKLKDILKKAPFRIPPRLTLQEQNFLRKMEKKGHSVEVRTIRNAVDFRKQAFRSKMLGMGAPAGMSLLIFGLLILLLIFIVSIIGTLMPWLFPDDENSNKGAASAFGMKGDKFYGGRLVYRDEELSRNGLVEQYADVIKSAKESVEGKTYTEIEVSGTKYTVNVTVELNLPEEDYFEQFNLTTFSTDYADLYSAVEEIAKFVYDKDNADGGAGAASAKETDLVTMLDGIKYFGFDADMIGDDITDENPDIDNNVMEIAFDLLKSKSTFNGEDAEGNEVALSYDDIKESANFKFKDNIVAKLDVDNNKKRTEKLFIKDIILEDAESYMQDVKKQNYVALIYLPKENVNFEYICYTITIDETAELNVTLFNNGSEISLTKGEGEDLSSGNNSFNGDVSIASEEEQVKEKTFMFKSNENLNQTANTTYVINSSSLNRFTNPSSLAKVLKEADWSTYLEETTLENGDTVLTYKKGNMYVLFETDAEFYLSEEIRYITK